MSARVASGSAIAASVAAVAASRSATVGLLMAPPPVPVRGAAQVRACESARPAGARCRRAGSRSRSCSRRPPLAQDDPALVLGQAAPDAELLGGVQRVGQ